MRKQKKYNHDFVMLTNTKKKYHELGGLHEARRKEMRKEKRRKEGMEKGEEERKEERMVGKDGCQ